MAAKKTIFIVTCFCLLLTIPAYRRLYSTKDKFTAPLPVKLILRNDSYGDGHFGAKRSGGRRHNGIDFLAEIKTPVLAAKTGIVQRTGYKGGNGNYVIIRHLWRYKTIYCHLAEMTVKNGWFVREGRVIGYVGKTGNADIAGIKPHLHFELHKNGVPQDQANFLTLKDN